MSFFRHTQNGLETAAKNTQQQTLQPVLRLGPTCARFTFEGRVAFAMEEIWKPVIGFEGLYEVSSLGRVKALFPGNHGGFKPGRILKPDVGKNGYSRVPLYHPATEYKPCHHIRKSLHVIILEAFKGPRPMGNISRHLDGVRSHNYESNLSWGTRSENEQDAKRHGTRIMGESHPLAKLTSTEVIQIRAMRNSGMTYPKIAERFGIDQSNVYCVVKGKTWTHV